MQCFSLENGVFTTPLSLKFNKKFSYIPYTGCVLEHILHTDSITNNEKLFYLLADSLSLISGNLETKQRSVALSSSTWAEKLNCSKTEIFSLQKSLEEKGYFIIIRDTNKCGKNKRNVIIPTLPDSVFYTLSKERDRFNSTLEDRLNLSILTPISKTTNASSLYEHANKRTYLDKSKLFIKLNYQILSIVVASNELSSFAKIVWLDFYSKCYKNHIKSKSYNYTKHLNDYFAFTCSYKELENSLSCSRHTISRTLLALEELGFIKRSRFHVKNDNIDDNLCDKSLWNITVTIPEEHIARSESLFPEDNKALQGNVTKSDPYCADSDQLYNKDSLINNNDLDSLDGKQKTSDDSVFSSSNLSVSYKNNEINKNYNESKNHSLLNNSILSDTKPSIPSKSGRSLNSFYPLTKEQVDKLNSSSKREFSVNFVNQLLLKLSSRDTSKLFISENHMMAYMGKAMLYEKHQSPLVNHESFRFAANLSKDDKYEQEIEKYLAEVESSPDTSYSSQLNRKIVEAFESKLAYQLLTQVRFDYIEHVKAIRTDTEKQVELGEEGRFPIILPKDLVLSYKQQETLENAITSVYGYVDIAYEIDENSSTQSSDNLPRLIGCCNQVHVVDHKGKGWSRQDTYDTEIQEVGASPIWSKVRQLLKAEMGAEVDKTWFSRLTAQDNPENLELKLYAPSPFYRDWINNHYGYILRRCCKEIGYQFMDIEV